MMGFPTDFFPVLFCIARTAGWLAHWKEQLKDQASIFQPGQVYTGHAPRAFVPMHQRKASKASSDGDKLKSRKEI